MTNVKNSLSIIELKIHLLDPTWYRYQRPITIHYSYNNKLIINHSNTGIKSIDKLYWPPYFVN